MVFGDKKQNNAKIAKRSHESSVTILTPGCHFNGKLYCKGSSRIAGRIEGEIVSEGLLIIEEEALITADIKADEAIIQGRVSGKLEAKGRVELSPTSHFEGDIMTPSLMIQEGAKFNGRATMPNEPLLTEASIPVVEKLYKKGAGKDVLPIKGDMPEVGVGK